MDEPMGSHERAAVVALDVLLEVDEVARAVTSATSVPDVLAAIAEGAQRLTRAPFVAVALYDGSGSITHWEHRGISAEVARRIGDPPIGRGLLRVPRDEESTRLDDLRGDERFRGFPRHHPEMGPFLGVVAKVRGHASRIYAAREPGAKPFTAGDEAAVRTLARHAAIALQNAAVREVLDQHNEYLRAVREIGGAISSSRDLATVGKAIVDGAVSALRADAAILLLEEQAGSLRAVAVSGYGALNDMPPLPIAGTTVGRVVMTGLPVFLEDVAHEASDGTAWPLEPAMVSAFLAPLRSRLGPRGVIGVSYARHTVPSSGMQDAFYALAELGSVAVDNARAIEHERELVVLKDRERIGMDLHDTALQEIFAMGMQLQLARDALGANPDEASSRIERVLGSLSQLNESIRSYIGSLSVAPLDGQATASELLAGVAGEVERLLDTEIDRDHLEADVPLPAGADPVNLSLLVREALVNAHVHGRASRVELILSRVGDGVIVAVVDNGVGFSVAAADRTGHYGLRNMRDRAAAMGADLRIESVPGCGTRVEAAFSR